MFQPGSAGWRNVFYVAAAIYIFGTIFYIVFGSGERQTWDDPKPGKDEVEEVPITLSRAGDNENKNPNIV